MLEELGGGGMSEGGGGFLGSRVGLEGETIV